MINNARLGVLLAASYGLAPILNPVAELILAEKSVRLDSVNFTLD
jgi:hypothetical protein